MAMREASHSGGGSDLNKAGVEAAPVVGHVFGDEDRGATVFTAKSKALEHANDNENDGREPSCGVIRGQHADERGSRAHDREGDDESETAAHHVADAAEEERAKRADEKSNGECGEVGDECEGVVAGRIELKRENGGQAAEDEEIVPLNHGAGSGGEDDALEADLISHTLRRGTGCHLRSTSQKTARRLLQQEMLWDLFDGELVLLATVRGEKCECQVKFRVMEKRGGDIEGERWSRPARKEEGTPPAQGYSVV
jgi:hypothetical protein